MTRFRNSKLRIFYIKTNKITILTHLNPKYCHLIVKIDYKMHM